MRTVVAACILLAAHFTLTIFVPGDKALVYWPWGNNTRPVVAGLGGLPRNDVLMTSLLAWLAGLAFLLAFAALFHTIVPETWFPVLVLAGSLASIILFGLHFSAVALLPIAINVILVFGILVQHWTVADLS